VRVVLEISSRTYRHTDRHTHHNTSQPLARGRGCDVLRSNNPFNHQGNQSSYAADADSHLLCIQVNSRSSKCEILSAVSYSVRRAWLVDKLDPLSMCATVHSLQRTHWRPHVITGTVLNPSAPCQLPLLLHFAAITLQLRVNSFWTVLSCVVLYYGYGTWDRERC